MADFTNDPDGSTSKLPVAYYGLELAFISTYSDPPSRTVKLDCKIDGRDPSKLCARDVIFTVGDYEGMTWRGMTRLSPELQGRDILEKCLRIWGIGQIELPTGGYINTSHGLAWMLAVAQQNFWRYNVEVAAYGIYTDGQRVPVSTETPVIIFRDDLTLLN